LIKGALISMDQQYRYVLWRIWDEAAPRLLFVGLNPSTADDQTDDPTVRRMMGFAKREDMGGIYVCNLFALRATDPRALRRVRDPVGKKNYAFLREKGAEASRIVCCWGCHGTFKEQDRKITKLLREQFADKLFCLGTTKKGHPKHPLYLNSASPLVPFGR